MLNNNWMKSWTRRAMGLMMLALLLPLTALASSNVPAVVITSQILTVNSPGLASNQTNLALDACGNMYSIQQGTGNVYETPAGGGAATDVMSNGWAYNWSGDISIYIDSAKANAYISEGFGGNSAQVARIPIVNCVLQTGSLVDIANNAGGGWWAAGAMTTDAAGDIFFSSWNGSNIIETSADQTTQTTLLSGLSGLPNALAVDLNGNLFYGLGNTLYELPYTPATSSTKGSYAATPVQIATGYTSLVGLTLDAAGNLYITDQGNNGWYGLNGYANAMYITSTISVIPYETTVTASGSTSALNPADTYIFAQGTGASDPIEAPSGVAIDFQGNLDSVLSSVISQLTVNSAQLASAAVGANSTTTIHVQFNASTSPASFSVISSSGAITNSGSGTCTAQTYAAGSSCTVNIKLAPSYPGPVYGSLQLIDASNNVLATAYLYGTGLGAGLTLDPGTVTSVGSGFSSPQSVAITYAGGFIADSGKNEVLYIATPSSAPVSIGNKLSKPLGVAVDGAGNVIIADTGNNQIVEVPVVNGLLSNADQVTISPFVLDSKGNKVPTAIAGAVLSAPAGVTVDGQGNLYIADTGNNRIVYVPFNGSWNVAGAMVLGSGFSAPLATTVDSYGNLYVADSGNGQIDELPYPVSQGVQQLVAVGFSNPSALATDASGSLFVVDQGANTVLRIPSISGALDPNDAIEVGFGVAAPYGLALDPIGDLCVTDATNSAVYEINRVSITDSFGDWALSTPSGALPVKLENEGNQTLTFNTPFYTATGNTADFSLGTPTGAEAACTDGGTVAIGTICELDAIFDPSANGVRTDTLALSSNAQNAAAPQVVLSGTGTAATATTTVLAITSPAGTPSFGEAITLTATVTASGGTPTGTVQLLVDGVISGNATLSSGGVATFSLPLGLTGGGHSLQAVYQGTSSFAGNSSPVMSITVSTTPTTSDLAILAPYTNPYSAVGHLLEPVANSNPQTYTWVPEFVTFTATIHFAGVGIPTGTVTFSTGSTALGTATLVPAAGGTFQASVTVEAAGPACVVSASVPACPTPSSDLQLPVGTDTITATYSGDANYVGSSNTGVISVMSTPLVTISASGSSLTTYSGSGVTTSITFTPTSYGSWNGLIGFGCEASTLPANARCIFSPGQIQAMYSTPTTPANNPTVTMTVTVDQPPQTPTASTLVWWLAAMTGLLLFIARRRFARGSWRAISSMLGVALLAIAATGMVACTNNNPPAYVTPTGNSTITVYAWSDPFTTPPTASSATPSTQSCPANNPASAPCAQQSFQVALTVK
jgi:sugar lactone lactonase YvrE